MSVRTILLTLAVTVFKLALYTSSANLGAATTAFTTTGQASGTNYSSGGSALTNVTPFATGTTAVCDFNDLTFSNATITARGCLIYNDTQSDKAVCAVDFGGDKTSTAGDFTVVLPNANSNRRYYSTSVIADAAIKDRVFKLA